MNLNRPLPNARRALQMAKARNLFPTEAGTAELREMERELLRRSVFSARVTNTRFLQAVKTRVERLLKSDAPDVGAARRELRGILKGLGYTTEKGFGDAEPVAPGSIQDLTSTARLDLILETQAQLLSGHAQRQHGLTPSSRERAPAWEFIRIKDSAAPRDWLRRWDIAGGRVTNEGGVSKFIALKSSPLWDALGDAALFDDALNVNHPPFAFNSGMAWASVSAKRAARLGIGADSASAKPSPLLPDSTLDVSDIDRPLLRKLRDKLRQIEAEEASAGKLRVRSKAKAPQPQTSDPEPESPRLAPAAKDALRAKRLAALREAQAEEINAALALVGHE